jgi:hypothetical protein
MNYVTFVDAPLELVRCVYHKSNSNRNYEPTNLAIWLTGAPRRGTPQQKMPGEKGYWKLQSTIGNRDLMVIQWVLNMYKCW